MKKKCTFKGSEPSPKGKGYCAKYHKIGKKMKGKDGNMWIIRKTKRGKRWFKLTKKLTRNKKRKNTKIKKMLDNFYDDMNDYPNPIALKM